MTKLETLSILSSTSAAGEKPIGQPIDPNFIGCLVSGLGTSIVFNALPDSVLRSQRTTAQTSAGDMVPPGLTPGAAIAELRRLTGLTWDQLARLFRVTRRSLHFWASGKRGTARNEEHLQRVLAVMRKVDRGYLSENRAALLEVRDDGIIPFELLIQGNYDRFLAVLGPGRGRPYPPAPQLSQEELEKRRPLPPWVLLGALHDRIAPASGPLIAAFPIPTKRRE